MNYKVQDSMKMEWTVLAEDIRELLGLKGNAVAITYAMHSPSGARHSKHRVCDAILMASHGDTLDLTINTCACPGGTWHLGLTAYPTGQKDRVAKDFLVNRERIYSSTTVCQKARGHVLPPPLGLADHVVLSPMDEAEFCPDAVLFICNAEQACRLVTLDSFESGTAPRVQMTGSTCYQAITYPVVSGEMNVSLMDYTSRHIRGYEPDDLLVTIPYYRFVNLMRRIDKCAAGRSKMRIPQSVLVRLLAHYNMAVPFAIAYLKAEEWSKKYLKIFKEKDK